MEKIEEQETAFFNIVQFANDLELWRKRKQIIYDELEKDIKRKEFVENHLSENFKNLIPNKKLLDSLSMLIPYKLMNGYQSPNFKFLLKFFFTERIIFEEKDFEFEIKLKDIATNCKVTNKNELKKIFYKLLYRMGYEIGYVQGMMEEIELQLQILRDEREGFVTKENIQDVSKIFYDNAIKQTERYDRYELLFEYTEYIVENFNIKSQIEYYRFIADVRERNFNLKEKDRLKLEDGIRVQYKRYEKKGIVPVLKDILSTEKQIKTINLHKTKSKSYVNNKSK